MSEAGEGYREGSLGAPTRHPIDWKNPEFYNEDAVLAEMQRVFEICHGCRRCVNLCNAFPTLFDLIDESESMDLEGVPRSDYGKVVDHCYLCDLCYMTKCPYVPPHEWNVDFPHLMLRGKAVAYKQGRSKLRDRVLTSTDTVGSIAGIPVVAQTVNAVNANHGARVVMDKLLGVHPDAILPKFHSKTLRKQMGRRPAKTAAVEPTGETRGRVGLFATCYCNRNAPDIGRDLVAVFEHNGIPVRLADKERCCGMPKLELGDLEAVREAKEANIPVLAKLVDEGWDLTALIPSCVLMFKQEIPLMFPDDPDVQKVKNAFYDPFEYLMLRHREGQFSTDFKQPLGKVSYHAACHQRVQNIGQKTREALSLIPDTTVEIIERCSGHDGTYAVKNEFHEYAMKIVRPVAKRISDAEADHYGSDCAMAGHHIENGLKDGRAPEHPVTLLRRAYGI
jgi:Fe-S oxidoreductase